MEHGFTLTQALHEASRCLLCHDAPCAAGCPATSAPDRFIRKLRLRNVKGAIATIKENNILGGICAVVCPTGALCEQRCVATGLDRPIRIGAIQRFLVEHGWQTGFRAVRPVAQTGPRVAIVGSGPAGLACAAELALHGLRPTVFDARPEPGGMLRYAIPAHRLSLEFVQREIADVRALGVEFVCNRRIADMAALEALKAEGFAAIFLALGAWHDTPLDLPGSAAAPPLKALPFLEGARLDPAAAAAAVSGRTVAVIGGGDTAMDCAVTAAKAGARDVYVVYRRSFTEMPAAPTERDLAVAHGVHFLILTRPTAYLSENGRLNGLAVVRTRLGACDASGRRAPEDAPGSAHTLAVDVVIEAIGFGPHEDARRFTGLDFDLQHRIRLSDDAGRTAVPGVYAGGDAVRGSSLVARAVGDGKRAARTIAADLAAQA